MPQIVITDLPKHAIVHTVKIAKWLTEYKHMIECTHLQTTRIECKLRDIQIVIDTLDYDNDLPF